jgi:thiamine biosynthesis lipoprotein
MMSHSQASSWAAEPWPELCRARPLLGTLVQIRASGPAARMHAGITAAFATIERLQALLSFQQADSELSLLNRQKLHTPCQVHPDTYAVLSAAIHFAQLSEGAFDPCVASDLQRWGMLPGQAPRSAPVDTSQGSWRDIELLGDRRVCLHRPVCLDLSGIAKGYAVDRAVAVLQAAGAEQILVNAGGDLRVAGPALEQIWLRHPSAPGRALHPIGLQEAALATSGAYYSRQSGPAGEVSALVNPANHRPYLSAGSVSVLAANCLSADALTKVVLFADARVAERALVACDATAFVLPEVAAALPRKPALRGAAQHAS